MIALNPSRAPKRLWLLLLLTAATAAVAWLPGALPAEKELLIPLEPDGLPRGLALTVVLPKNVGIRVKGPKSIVSDLCGANLVYRLDLSGALRGFQTIELQEKALALPASLSITAFSPTFIPIQTDQRMVKRVSIVPNLVGRPAAGFVLASSQALPRSASLSGPEGRLAPLNAIRTQPIEIDGAMETFQRKVPLDLPELVTTDPASELVTARIVVEELTESRVITGLPIAGANTTHRYRIAPPTLDLTLRGPARVLDKLQAEEGIRVYVDLKGLKPGHHHERAIISLPATVTVTAVSPERFAVELIQRK